MNTHTWDAERQRTSDMMEALADAELASPHAGQGDEGELWDGEYTDELLVQWGRELDERLSRIGFQ